MNCDECGHLFMKHDDCGCKQAACECMKNQPELMCEYSLPVLPSGLRFLRSGYTKEFNIHPDALYDIVLKVIEEIGTFTVRKQSRSDMIIMTKTRPFGRLLSTPTSDSMNLAALNDAFEMEISVLADGTDDSILKLQVPVARYKQMDAPPEYRRTFFHLHAAEFVRRVDSMIAPPSMAD